MFKAKKNAASQEFQRKTTKYWVHQDDIPEMKRIILGQMPEFTFSKKISNLVQSLYLDNDYLRRYQDRIMMINRGMLFRYRWYGDGDPKIGFMEQKIRKLGWRSLPGERSVKRRFKLKPELLVPFLNGDYVPSAENTDPPLDQASLDLAAEIQGHILNQNLKPMVRTAYNRTCYQGSFDAPIRVSFDENLQFSVCRNNEAFIGDPSQLMQRLDPMEFYDFPHGVLEIKVRLSGSGADFLPDWAQEMVDRGIIVASDKFSKFNSAVGLLLNSRVDKIPYFFPLIDKFTRAPDVTIQVKKDPNRATPRHYFTIERVFLKWLRTSMFFAIMGISLLGFNISNFVGCCFVLMACLLSIRAVYIYYRRIQLLLLQRKRMIYDQYSPLICCAVFILGVLLQSYGKNANAFFTSPT